MLLLKSRTRVKRYRMMPLTHKPDIKRTLTWDKNPTQVTAERTTNHPTMCNAIITRALCGSVSDCTCTSVCVYACTGACASSRRVRTYVGV